MDALVRRECAGWKGRSANALRAVAAADEVAREPDDFALAAEFEDGPLAVERVQRDVVHAKINLPSRCDPRGDEVLDDLMLRIDGDGLPPVRS
jgi:hypothetical protein